MDLESGYNPLQSLFVQEQAEKSPFCTVGFLTLTKGRGGDTVSLEMKTFSFIENIFFFNSNKTDR